MIASFLERFHPHLLYAMGGILGVLVVATVVVRLMRASSPQRDFSELSQRVNCWWVMAGVFLFAISFHRNVSLTFFAFMSFMAFKEYLSIIETRRADHRVLFWAYLSIPLQYAFIWMEWYGMFVVFVPVYVFLFLPLRMVLIGETEGFLKAAGTTHWGLMKTVFCMGHLAYLLVLPERNSVGELINPHGNGAALILFLVFLTQANDVLQYIWGKSIGKRKIVPKVSPGKTWGGFLGGLGTTIVLSYFLAPWFTPLTEIESLVAGLLIAGSGFIGDVVMSAVKRDLGIKDSGSMLPGHGGILDRIDSLMYTAPLFFHFVYWRHYPIPISPMG